jgi:hypothetical protein
MCARGADNAARKSGLAIECNATLYFRELLVEAQERQKLRIKEHVEFYLVNLLVDYLSIDPSQQSDCLALTFARAQASSHGERMLLFKQLADSSLYFAGFFQEYFLKKGLSLDYCITMGSNGYQQLADMMRGRGKAERNFARLYGDMAHTFRESVVLLLDVSRHTIHQGEPSEGILQIYENWLDTASQGLEQELRELGIFPIMNNKKTLQ